MNELAENKVTTKEISEILGVDVRTVLRTADKLGYDSTFAPLKTAGGTQNVRVFDEKQVTTIKQEIQKHHNLASRQIDTVSTDLEVIGNAINAFNALQQLYNQKEAEYKATIERQKQQIELEAPKVEWFDDVAESKNLIEIGTEGKKCGYGVIEFFRKLQADKIIYKKAVDGVEYYLPYAPFEKHFRSVPIPFKKADGTKMTRNKLMFTQSGGQWIESKYKNAKAS